MPKRISFSLMPRGSGPVGTAGQAVGAVAAFAAVAAAAGDGPMTLDRLGPEIERSRSASWRSARMQSILPEVTAARPSATVRSNVWVRSERSASFDEASRITWENLSTMVWMRGRAMSRQACAEPITGPTRLARSRTIAMSAAAWALPAIPNSMAPTSRVIRCEVMANSVENKIAVRRFSGMVSPPSGLCGVVRCGAAGSGFSRHCMNCWSNWPYCSDAAGALAGVAARRAWNSLIAGFCEASPGWRQRVPDRLCEVGERRRRSPSLWRDPGTATTKNSATRAATPTAAAKRAATVHNAFFDSRSGSCISSGSSGWRSASDTALSSWESNDAAVNGASRLAAARSRPFPQRARRVVQGIAGIEMILLTHTTHTLTPHDTWRIGTWRIGAGGLADGETAADVIGQEFQFMRAGARRNPRQLLHAPLGSAGRFKSRCGASSSWRPTTTCLRDHVSRPHHPHGFHGL